MTHKSFSKLFIQRNSFTTTEQRHGRLNIGTTQEWGKICQKGSLRKPLTAIAPPSTQAPQCYYYILLQGCTPRKLTTQCVHLCKNLHFTFFGIRPRFTHYFRSSARGGGSINSFSLSRPFIQIRVLFSLLISSY